MSHLRVRNLGKAYKRYARKSGRLLEWMGLGVQHEMKWVLRDISLRIEKGETFCIIGENGSGKSTLLKLIAGILEPTQGTVQVHGRMTTLLELGSGFNPEFTGRENLYLNAAIHGLIDTTPNDRLADRAWGYVTLGFGHGEPWWREFCIALRLAGYDDVLSIEHEDLLLPPEEGVRRSVDVLCAAASFA